MSHIAPKTYLYPPVFLLQLYGELTQPVGEFLLLQQVRVPVDPPLEVTDPVFAVQQLPLCALQLPYQLITARACLAEQLPQSFDFVSVLVLYLENPKRCVGISTVEYTHVLQI